MPRATQPVSIEEAQAAIGDHYPSIDCETKPENFGRIGSAVVILDYGIPDADCVRERRRYLAEKASAKV